MAKRKAESAPAPAPAAPAAGAVAPEAVAQAASGVGDTATADDSAALAPVAPPAEPPAALIVEDTPAALAMPETDEWPLAVAIYNHSHADLTCRVSGAYLPAAGFAKTHLHDPDHARAVAESLTQLAAANFIELSKLVIEKA